ncbi:aminoglycoside phosphotransferase family protein [Streptomyces antimicrobicus]|uniref:Aminoglycoside phosphotransferase family protein n=1 Tax=Streptomyces antimicrobicus TaxID=2883108 RepID=A0ABS8B2N4_9ACTN|nr:aminoglycoside phosphotransferase family protein [Streptomyces antimicrobicus]MCB5178873.1 aminoglycoside phosphotransferase family protein [Streptomyces antimicrobicus]
MSEVGGAGGVGDAVEVPEGLARAQLRFNGEAGRAFVAALPGRVAQFLERWELRRDGPVLHGVTALVLPVRRRDGSGAALKVSMPDDESAGEPVALRRWAGEGCVRLLEHDPATGTLLLERLDHGRHLSVVAEDEPRAAVQVVAGLLARLTAVPAPAGLRRLEDEVRGLLARVPAVVGRLADPVERGLVRAWGAQVAEVAGESGDRLLHWDLHFDNVLAAGREPWLAIDPKPLAGDPGFDLLPALRDRFDAGDVRWRFDLMTEALGLDRRRARVWTLARVLQNAVWDVEEGERRLDGEQVALVERLPGA